MTIQTKTMRRFGVGLSVFAFTASIVLVAPKLRSQIPNTSPPTAQRVAPNASPNSAPPSVATRDSDSVYLALNPGFSIGRLRIMQEGMIPASHDIVICDEAPEDLPRVAGIIATTRFSPVDDVNLRAVQDGIPNAFIRQAVGEQSVQPYLNQWVAYRVGLTDFELRPATRESAEKYQQAARSPIRQTPVRDLSVRRVQRLIECDYTDRTHIGAKAGNIAALHNIGLPDGTVPDGYAVPFFFYNEFMRYNGLYDYAQHLIRNVQFQRDRSTRVSELKKMRALIKKGKMPQWMLESLDELQQSFATGTSIRCRSSTNTESLPGFGGAGLYDSYTHHPDEGHLSKSIKQVYASLWNIRAFDEREFHRVDHLSAAMAVLVHPSFQSERASGVAVTQDIVYRSNGFHYVYTDLEDDLLEQTRQKLRPEELLLPHANNDRAKVIRSADKRSPYGESVLSPEHLQQLKHFLNLIHRRFADLLQESPDSPTFAMEIEFKITSNGTLAIKQARRWGVTTSAKIESN